MKTDMKTIIIPDFMIFLKTLEKENEMSIKDIEKRSEITYSHLYKLKKVALLKKWIKIRVNHNKKHLISLDFEGRNLLLAINDLLKKLKIREEDLRKYRLKTKINKKEEKKMYDDDSMIEDIEELDKIDKNLLEEVDEEDDIYN